MTDLVVWIIGATTQIAELDEDESNRLYSISAAAIFILKFIISAGPGSHKAASVIIWDVTTMRAVEGF